MISTSPVGSPFAQRLERLKSMVPAEENTSLRITPEKIQRNREVTQLFHDIGIELDHMLNRQGPPSGANWPLWAAHASERAGAFIRGETTVMGLKGPGRNFLHQANGIAMGDIGGPCTLNTFGNCVPGLPAAISARPDRGPNENI